MGGGKSGGITSGMWMALAAALLGWMFDGFEQGIFMIVARPALVDILSLKDEVKRSQDPSASDKERTDAKARVDAPVGAWIARIVAGFLIGAALGGWFFGWLGDRIGRVQAMIFSVLTYAVFTGLCGFAQNPWHLAGLRFLSALGMGGEWALGVALVMESWPARIKPLLAGVIGASANIGFMLTTLPVLLVEGIGAQVGEGGWRWVLGVSAFPALLTFFFRMYVPESEKWLQASRTGPKAKLTDIFVPALRWRTLIGACLGAIALIGTWSSVQWVPPWVHKETGNQDLASLAQLCSGFGAVLGCLCVAGLGFLVRRRWVYFLLALGSLLVCQFLFRWDMKNVDWRFFATVILTGAMTAGFYGWFPLYLPELFPTRVRATGQGFCYNSGRIIAAGGAMSMGFLMSETMFKGSYALAGSTITLVYVLGLLIVWLAPETFGKPMPE